MAVVTGPAPLVLRTDGADATRALAGRVARVCLPGDVLLLSGDLGAGKTTFAQGFGAALGVTEPVTSPTFTLVRQYPVAGAGAGAGGVRTLVHADVWRLDHLHEIVDLGLGELVEDGAVALVEWGDAAGPVLGQDALAVELAAEVGELAAEVGELAAEVGELAAEVGELAAEVGELAAGDTDDHRAITLRPSGERWLARWDVLSDALTEWRVGP
jgi:tRNA threonylcarbamoyladenosine biosynthesis protein TsaE